MLEELGELLLLLLLLLLLMLAEWQP